MMRMLIQVPKPRFKIGIKPDIFNVKMLKMPDFAWATGALWGLVRPYIKPYIEYYDILVHSKLVIDL
jgi:hypothetical protein